MWSAIIGDLSGLNLEFRQVSEVIIDKLITSKSRFIEDTILNNGDYAHYLRLYVRQFEDYHVFFITLFRRGFMEWSKGDLSRQ